MSLLSVLLPLLLIPFQQKVSNSCDFDCWLANLVINIRPLSIDFPYALSRLNITDISIMNISISGVNTKYYPDETKIDDGLRFNIKLSMGFVANLISTGLLKFNGNISANINDVDFDFALQLIQDKDGLITNISIYDGDICYVEIGKIDISLHFDSEIADDIISKLKDLIDAAIKTLIESNLCSELEPLVSEYGTQGFEYINKYIRPYLNGTTPIDIPIHAEQMSDLSTSQVFDILRYILSNLTLMDGPLNINHIFNKLSNSTGILDYRKLASDFNLPYPLEFRFSVNNTDDNASFSVNFENLAISGLNTWTEFSFFDPISEFVLESRTGLDQLGINISFQVNVSSEGVVESDHIDLTENFFLHMFLRKNLLNFQMQYAHPKDLGINYTTNQCLDLNCIMSLSSPKGTGIKMIELETEVTEIENTITSGSLEEDIQESINSIIKFFITNYRSKIPILFTGLIQEHGLQPLNNLLNQTLSNVSCPFIPNDPYAPFNAFVSWLTCGIILGVMIILLIILFIVYKQREIMMLIRTASKSNLGTESLTSSLADDSYSNSENIAQPLLQDELAVGKWQSFWRQDEESSLLMHPRLPLWLRLLIPFLILSNIWLFLSSNGSIGGSVFPKVILGDTRRIEFPSMFDCGLINSIRDMWKAKTYALSILVACMSCVWPYMKLILMLIAWMIPTTIISAKHRERILRVLDELGKWSLLDSYFMILMVVAFHFVLRIPIVNVEKISTERIVYLWVLPVYGFLGLIGGTLYSLALSHIICAIERYVAKQKRDEERENKTLCVFKEQNLASKIILPIFLPVLFGLFIYGILCHSFSFKFVGLTGLALNIFNTPNEAAYTVFELAYKFPQACEFPNSPGVRFIQVIYIITAIITPLLHIISLAITLFVPMKKKVLRFMYYVIEYLYAWNCLDVFTLSVFICIIQITQFTNFMTGHRCDLINLILKKYFDDEMFIKGHEKCFEVLTVLQTGTFCLIAATIINTIAAVWINSITRKVLNKDDEEGNYVMVDDQPTLLMSANNDTTE